MVEISKFLVINEQKDQGTEAECCPQCGSLGVAHFEDETDTPSELQHRCLRCDWTWYGCTVSTGPTRILRLDNIYNKIEEKN